MYTCQVRNPFDKSIFCSYIVGMLGRPKKPKAKQKTNVLRIRLTESDRKLLDVAAAQDHLDTSTWARTILLGMATKKPAQSS